MLEINFKTYAHQVLTSEDLSGLFQIFFVICWADNLYRNMQPSSFDQAGGKTGLPGEIALHGFMVCR